MFFFTVCAILDEVFTPPDVDDDLLLATIVAVPDLRATDCDELFVSEVSPCEGALFAADVPDRLARTPWRSGWFRTFSSSLDDDCFHNPALLMRLPTEYVTLAGSRMGQGSDMTPTLP